jgi:hypothetical protein
MMFKSKRIHLRPVSNELKASIHESDTQIGVEVPPRVVSVPVAASGIINREEWPNQM